MKDAVYTFVFVIFVLMQLGAWFWFSKKVTSDLNRLKKNGDLSAREDKLIKLYQMIEETMDAFEEYVEESREGIEAERERLVKMSGSLEGEYRALLSKIEARVTELSEPEAQRAILPEAVPAAVQAKAPAVQDGERIKVPPTVAAGSYAKAPSAKSKNEPVEASAPKEVSAPAEPETPEDSLLSQSRRRELSAFSTKTQRVRFLSGIGLTNEEIAKELKIGNGEVRLIMNINSGMGA